MSRITLDPAVLPYLHLRDFHPLWLVFPVPFCLARQSRPQSEPRNASIPVWAPPRSLAATCGITFVFSSSGYLDVSVHRVPSSQREVTVLLLPGFPHSEICGSLVTCTSPQLIAAYRVLLRLIWPRHPPYALTYLTYLLSFLRFELSNFLKRSFFVSYVFM